MSPDRMGSAKGQEGDAVLRLEKAAESTCDEEGAGLAIYY
jgi:hypothetical protein